MTDTGVAKTQQDCCCACHAEAKALSLTSYTVFEDYDAPEEEGFSWKTSPAGRVSVTTALVTLVEPVFLTTIVYSTTLLISVLGTLAVLVMVTAEGICSCNDNSTQRHTI